MSVKKSHESVTIMIELDKPEWHPVTAGNGDELNLHRSGQGLRVVTDYTQFALSTTFCLSASKFIISTLNKRGMLKI